MTNSICAEPTKVPRLDSLHHQLQTARDADGNPLPLVDDLLFFLDDPPPGTGNRWEAGAELCAEHGIITSRMSVWRFYRSQIVQWRREQNPPPPVPAPDENEIARLEDHARYLAAQRAIEILNDPRLTPAQLIAILRHQNQRDRTELARDTYYEKVTVRMRREKIENRKRMKEMVDKHNEAEIKQDMADDIRAALFHYLASLESPPEKGGLRSPTEGGKSQASSPNDVQPPTETPQGNATANTPHPAP
jgi:hypothetical protein